MAAVLTGLDGWRDMAACRGADPELFYPPKQGPEDVTYRSARRICGGCPVAADCLAEAMRLEAWGGKYATFGMWGGLTPRQRLHLRRKRG